MTRIFIERKLEENWSKLPFMIESIFLDDVFVEQQIDNK